MKIQGAKNFWNLCILALTNNNIFVPYYMQAHSWVNVESQLKACYVGPLVNSSPNTQRRNSFNIKKNARKQNDTLLVPKTIVSNDGKLSIIILLYQYQVFFPQDHHTIITDGIHKIIPTSGAFFFNQKHSW